MFVWLNDEEGPVGIRHVPDYGCGWPAGDYGHQPLRAVDGTAACDQLYWRADLCWSDGLRHAADQEHVCLCGGHGLDWENGDYGRAYPVSRFHQHVHLPAAVHVQPRVIDSRS